MSLHFDLKVGRRTIEFMEIQRISNTRETVLGPDEVSRYAVRVNGTEKAQVSHRYGDGPWTLLKVALEEVGDL